MLNDLFIARDNIGFIRHYLATTQSPSHDYLRRLDESEKKQTMTYTVWWGLLDELQRQQVKPALGIDIGALIRIEHCGLLGYVFRTSKDLQQAIICFLRYQQLLYAGGAAALETVSSKEIKICWPTAALYAHKLSDEVLLSGIVSVIRAVLADARFTPTRVSFCHRASDQALAQYRDFFQCPVTSSAPYLSLSLSSEALSRPLKQADQNLHALLNQQATMAMQHLPKATDFIHTAKQLLIRLVHEGRPDAGALAAELHLSSRSLHRRLLASNYVFKDLLREVRQALAAHYLKDERLTLAEIALMLAYQDQSAFSRAFNNWFGYSPSRYRRQLLQTPVASKPRE